MALGNTPKRVTNIYLEANKSFVLNVRFTNADDTPYDVTGSEVRLVATIQDSRFYADAGNRLFLLVAEQLATDLVQFQFQAADLDRAPGEYPYDMTLLSPSDYSTPLLKGSLVIGKNTDPDNTNVFTDVSPGTEVEVVFGNSCDVVVCLQHVAPSNGGYEPPAPDTTWTIVSATDPGDPTGMSNPYGEMSTPLWIDLSEDYLPPPGGGGGDPGGDPEWLSPELQNGWITYTVGMTKPPVYRKLSSGLVVIEGTVAPGSIGSLIMTLPVGYRPNDGRLTFTAPCEPGFCRVDLLSNGDLMHVSGTPGAWVSLSDISFYGEEGTDIPGEPPPGEEEDMYGEHIIVWNPDAGAWVYRGGVTMIRPTGIPAYNSGARVVWDTSMDETFTTPPPLALVGDVWFPHGDVDPLA